MSGRPSKATEQAAAAYKKAMEAGTPMTVLELCHKFKLAPSTIYRAEWYKEQQKAKQAAQ